MSGQSVATRYAKAMALLVREQGLDQQQIYRESKLLEACLAPQSELAQLLMEHSVPIEAKVQIICQALTDKVHPLWIKFVELMLRKHREMHLHNALLLYGEHHRREHGILEVKVETAHPLQPAEEERVVQLITELYHKTVELQVELRPELIAGLVLIVDGKMADLSVHGQLREVRKTLGIN